jgi:NADPH-dependent curcumin reductase CurA
MNEVMVNRVWRLVKHPVGEVKLSDLELCREAVPAPADGEVLLKHLYLSVDPGQRVYMNDAFTLHEKAGFLVSKGTPLHGWAIGQVIASKSPRFPVGSYARDLYGDAGVQEYSVLPAEKLIAVDPAIAPLPIFLGPLGLPGLTAYFGLLNIGEPKAGETVVVSAASGAVGSAAGQIAKIKGCRVVGLTGGADKCRFLVDELGFDAAIDRKTGDLRRALKEKCPDGIDIYFDNVGGPLLDECMTHMRMFGRIVFCGALLAYNATAPMPGLSNYYYILLKQVRWQGYSVPYFDRLYPEALAEMQTWYGQGRLRQREDVAVGIEQFPRCLNRMFAGENFGKVLIKLEQQDA